MAFSLQLCQEGQHPGCLYAYVDIPFKKISCQQLSFTTLTMYFWSIWCYFNGEKCAFLSKTRTFLYWNRTNELNWSHIIQWVVLWSNNVDRCWPVSRTEYLFQYNNIPLTAP
jgi:hypothetical protein